MADIVGRNADLADIERFLDGVAGRVLLVEGEIGIGKTTLLSAAREAAETRGYEVLAARAVESEAHLGFATLTDLLEPVAAAALDELLAPQRRAIEVALIRQDPGEHPLDPRSVATATL